MDLDQFKKAANGKKEENRKFLKKLKEHPPKNLDQQFHQLHEEAFEHIDCLTCANCCKTTGPLFTQKDIDRLALHLKMKPARFIETYLHIDEDRDYVLNTLPCPFLGADNYCCIRTSAQCMPRIPTYQPAKNAYHSERNLSQ